MSSVTTTVADIYRYVVGVDTHAATPGLLTWERAEAGVQGFDVHFRVLDRGR